MNTNNSEQASFTEIEQNFSALNISNLSEKDQIFQSYIEKIHSNIPELEFEGVMLIRKELSKDSNPEIDKVIQTNIVPTLIEMAYQRAEYFTYEVCWILCNIASGDSSQINYLLNHSSLQFFEKVFDSNSIRLKDQVVWGIGNIAGESVKYRDLINTSSLFDKIFEYGYQILSLNDSAFIENYIWTLTNCARGTPAPSQNVLQKLDQVFIANISRHLDKTVLSYLLWGLSYVSESLNDINHYSTEVIPKAVQVMRIPDLQLQMPCLKVIGNFISKGPNSWNLLKSFNFLRTLYELLDHPKHVIRREAVWIMSNLASETSEVVQELFQSKAIHKLVDSVGREDLGVVREIVWTLSNCFFTSEVQHVTEMVQMGFLEKLVDIACDFNDPRLKSTALEGIYEGLYKVPKGFNAQVRKKLRNLLKISEKDFEINSRISKILLNFDGNDDDCFDHLVIDVEMEGNN